MKQKQRKLLWSLFALYVIALVFLLLFRTPRSEYSYNLLPLKTIQEYLIVLSRSDSAGHALWPYALANILGNTLLLVPLGVFLPLLFRWQRIFPIFLLTALIMICLVELLQYYTQLGALDVDDLILNLFGASLGWLGWKIWPRSPEET